MIAFSYCGALSAHDVYDFLETYVNADKELWISTKEKLVFISDKGLVCTLT